MHPLPQAVNDAFLAGKKRFQMERRQMQGIPVFPVGPGKVHHLVGIQLDGKAAHAGEMGQKLLRDGQRQRRRPQDMAFPIGGHAAVAGDEVAQKWQLQHLRRHGGNAAAGGHYDLDAAGGRPGECFPVGFRESCVVLPQQGTVQIDSDEFDFGGCHVGGSFRKVR